MPNKLETKKLQQQELILTNNRQIMSSTTTAANTTTTTTTTTTSPSASTPRIMQADEDFNIRFVTMVKKHRCLYDKKVPEYRNRDYQEKAWSVISQETRENVIHCKERWRNLRACLSRYIKQQSGNDPQHKPYYLTEHMAFLLPFLKSIRQSVDSSQSIFNIQNTLNEYKYNQSSDLELKHSLSDNEETSDAFDNSGAQLNRPPETSTPLSDTNSAHTSTMNNFIPDVQIEMRETPDANSEIIFSPTTAPHINGHHHHHNQQHHGQHSFPQPKRIKLEQQSGSNERSPDQYYNNHVENSDMEFFRSILPDIADLTPLQKRKLKIGLLELIDEVLVKYPAPQNQSTNNNNNNSSSSNNQQSIGYWGK
ncbi:probable serine/threonine-protein kinase DDB_G0288147 [Episyrphus balteatus]|uniref:probable serine/threonine-protein kinase DDB_G0288147 n=1 Tax=Episyrphus balteatus TaxID=286459 RepID=UPI002485064B|nr:probable serine/threonine-protein kinase DDB_G0288147 [Episyrphus balteatus]XP_055850902.1 probable serine/threonine-protein kinase DDB_G0288147 [Episyrphus balteatus]XP_055850903.1 probable serine/threonine-protein kinase DDB_G0288147 [Episyrphus balteatus]